MPQNPPAYVYVLGHASARGYLTYVGWTFDLERRLNEHNHHPTKGAKSTRGRHWVMLYCEKHLDKRLAMQREWHLKRERAFRKKLSLTAVG